MTWTKTKILHELRKLHKAGADLSYTAMKRRKQRLLSAAAHHFTSYWHALERAGIDYSEHLRRPRWTKSAIVALIRHAQREGEDLNWSRVTRGRDELSRAAFASLQGRLFGSWGHALHAAGVRVADVNAYRVWNRRKIVTELRHRFRDDAAMSSGRVQRENPALHAAIFRHFRRYDRALRAAGIKPSQVRLRHPPA